MEWSDVICLSLINNEHPLKIWHELNNFQPPCGCMAGWCWVQVCGAVRTLAQVQFAVEVWCVGSYGCNLSALVTAMHWRDSARGTAHMLRKIEKPPKYYPNASAVCKCTLWTKYQRPIFYTSNISTSALCKRTPAGQQEQRPHLSFRL